MEIRVQTRTDKSCRPDNGFYNNNNNSDEDDDGVASSRRENMAQLLCYINGTNEVDVSEKMVIIASVWVGECCL